MIVPILKKGDVCSYHRLLLPFKYGGWWHDKFETSSLQDLMAEASAVIFNRYSGSDIIDLIRFRKKYGTKIIVDLDDYWQLYPNHVGYKSWNEFNMPQKIKEALMNSDFVFVTTKRLAKAVEDFNKKVEVIPNALPFDDGQFTVSNKKECDKLRILSSGGKTHKDDLRTLSPCLNKLGRFNSGSYEFVLGGYDSYDSDGTWEKTEKIVRGNGKNYRRVNRLPLDNYMEVYDEGDVVVAPLEENYFNMFKSNLKIQEAGCKNMPIITENFPPYSDEPSDLIMKASTTNQWYNHILYCIKNPHFVKERGEELGQYVRKYYDLRKINSIRQQVFDTLT